jgi:hypothetical protein
MKNILLVMTTIIVILYALSLQSFAQIQPPPREKIDTSPRLVPLPPTGPSAPKVTAFTINNGAPSTKSRTVTLNNLYYTPGGASAYRASEKIDFSDTYWRTYSNAPQFLLNAGNGQKTVYFQVRNSNNVVSNIASDTIILTEYKIFNVFPGYAYEYAKEKGYTFTAIANDPNSECRISRTQNPPGDLLISTHGRLGNMGAKCDFALFNGLLHEGWTFKYDVIDNNSCYPSSSGNRNHSFIEKPFKDGRSITYKIRGWCDAINVLPTTSGCYCTIYLKSITLEGPATGRWEDAFQR